MNIQVNKVPRVVEVLPGFPAEAAGIRRGHVLVRVNDKPVDASNWFEEYQASQLPFTLTLDTAVPLHPDNPFFKAPPKRDHQHHPEGKHQHHPEGKHQHHSGEHAEGEAEAETEGEAEGEPEGEPEENADYLDENQLALLKEFENMTAEEELEGLEENYPEQPAEEEPVPTTG